MHKYILWEQIFLQKPRIGCEKVAQLFHKIYGWVHHVASRNCKWNELTSQGCTKVNKCALKKSDVLEENSYNTLQITSLSK